MWIHLFIKCFSIALPEVSNKPIGNLSCGETRFFVEFWYGNYICLYPCFWEVVERKYSIYDFR
jgi:hypothetical protein